MFAILFFGFANATYGARAAARYCSVHSPASLAPCGSTASPGCSQEAALIQPLIFGAAPNGLSISTSYPTGDHVGGWVVVKVTVNYNVTLPFSQFSTVTIGSQSQRPIIR